MSDLPKDSPDYDSVGAQLTRIISMLVDNPLAVDVQAKPSRSATIFEVRVDEDNLGQLIGRQGRTARALRALLDARGSLDGQQYGLEIRES